MKNSMKPSETGTARPAAGPLLRYLFLLFLLMFSTCPAAAGSMAENAREGYEALKAAIEADAEKDKGNFFDEDIDRLRESLGPGFNFGNEMDWSYQNKKVRKYGLRFTLCSGEKELFNAEIQFDMTGGLNAQALDPDSGQKYARLKFAQNEAVSFTPDMPVDALRVYLFNPMEAAAGTEVSVAIKYLSLINKDGQEIVPGGPVLKEYPVSVSPEGTAVVTVPIEGTAEDFMGADAEIRADALMDGFLSDYWDDPARVYRETYNGEPATDAELAFLKAQGFRTIRLPVTWGPHMDSSGTIDPGWFDEVNKITDRILSYGFTVIVDIHHDAGKSGWITANEADFELYESLYRYLVLQIAENFKHYGSALILEGPNEVINTARKDPETFAKPDRDAGMLNHINQIFVDEVRRIGYNNTKRFLMVSPWYGIAKNLRKFALPQDPAGDKLLTSIHEFSIEKDGMLKALIFLQGEGAYLLDQFHPVMGEFGILREKGSKEKVSFMEKNMALAKELGIPMILWDDGGEYALMKKQAAEWDKDYGSDRAAEAMIRD